jgi:hypothetical protein
MGAGGRVCLSAGLLIGVLAGCGLGGDNSDTTTIPITRTAEFGVHVRNIYKTFTTDCVATGGDFADCTITFKHRKPFRCRHVKLSDLPAPNARHPELSLIC